VISPERKLRHNAVMSSNVRGRGWVGVCGSILLNRKGGQSKALSTYNAAITSPQILAAERGAVGIAKSSIWEFVPRGRITDLASASFIDYV
jgi:hypothetical protein